MDGTSLVEQQAQQNNMNNEEKADQLELAARVIRGDLEWEYKFREEWVSGKNFDLMKALDACDVIRIKPETKRVPLGPEDVPLGSGIRSDAYPSLIHALVLRSAHNGVCICGQTGNPYIVEWTELMDEWQIKRPGQDWMPCWKEAAE